MGIERSHWKESFKHSTMGGECSHTAMCNCVAHRKSWMALSRGLCKVQTAILRAECTGKGEVSAFNGMFI